MKRRITAADARRYLEIARKGGDIDQGLELAYDWIECACVLQRESQIELDSEFQQKFLFSTKDMQAIVDLLRADGYIVTQDAGKITVSWERAV